MAWGAVIESQDRRLVMSATALTAVAIVRTAMAYLLPRLTSFDKKTLEVLFEIGAFAYSALLGLVAAECIFFDTSASVQTLTVCNAIGYGVGISARNATSFSADRP